MQQHRSLSKTAATLGAAVLVIALTGGIALAAASEFVGTWKVADTHGKPMAITLYANGSAKGVRVNETLVGTWKDKRKKAVIKWTTGWETKILKKGDHYEKVAYAKSKFPKGKPVNRSVAVKVH